MFSRCLSRRLAPFSSVLLLSLLLATPSQSAHGAIPDSLARSVSPRTVVAAPLHDTVPALAVADETVSEVLASAVAVAAGGEHTCAVTAGGGAKCWGANRTGALGDGTTTDRLTPVSVSGLDSGVAAITAGNDHTCALTIVGGVKCWGYNGKGQVGDGAPTTTRPTPVDVSGLASGVLAISAGHDHTCAVTSSGAVKCWGDNSYGQLGDGTTSQRATPTAVIGLGSAAVAVAAGGYWEDAHTCVLTSQGAVMCWGSNANGQLGDGSTTSSLCPVNVSGLSSGVRGISAGEHHTCALTNGGGIKCWGDNDDGQLGDGGSMDRSIPGDVFGLTNSVNGIATGGAHTCALTAGGGVKCWGDNFDGQLGDGTSVGFGFPHDVSGLTNGVDAITAGGGNTCAITVGGGLKCWGRNNYGQLGIGTTTDRSIPVNVTGLTGGVVMMAAGYLHTCALMENGEVKCWGDHEWPPTSVGGLSGALSIAAGGAIPHNCALTRGGGVKCWGFNRWGQLGDGTTTYRSSPVNVSGLSSGVRAIAAGACHTCAVTTNGEAKCWGCNDYGQLGDGTMTERHMPVTVSGLDSGVDSIDAGNAHTCALLSGGGIKCWGSNNYGQLGDGTTQGRSTPVDVSGLGCTAAAVVDGGGHTCALLVGGGVKCWGDNTFGQLGDGTEWARSTPVDVVGMKQGVAAVVAGGGHTCALMSNGGAKCWGWNDYGELGDGTTNERHLPTDVIGLDSSVTAAMAGDFHTCAVVSGGSAYCWGSNEYGQLGINPGWTPMDVIGFGGDAYAVAGRVVDGGGSGLTGVVVWAGAGWSATTDGNGSYTLPVLPAGMYTLTPSKSGYTFSPPSSSVAVPPDATGVNFTGMSTATITAAMSEFATNSSERLAQVLAEAQHSAQDGDYFAVQRQADEIRTVAETMLDAANVLATPFGSINRVKDLTKMQAPGVIGSGWGHVIRLRNQYEPARDAFRKALFVAPLSSETALLASQEHLKGALIYYGAGALDKAAEELVTDGAIQYGLQVGLQSELGLQSRNYPALSRLSAVFQQDITDTAAAAIAQLTSLTPAEEQSYKTDLKQRSLANTYLAFSLERRALPLHLAQDARESNPGGIVPWLEGFLAKYFIRCTAGLRFDGPGVLAVESVTALYNAYQNIQRLKEDTRMMTLGAETLGGALDAQKRVYLNSAHGLDGIAKRIPPQIPDATVVSISHTSLGEYIPFGIRCRPCWFERSSYSEVSLSNNTAFDTDLQVIADYGSTGLLGTSFEPLVAEGATPIGGGNGGSVYVRYKQDGQGASPDEGSSININILGSTDTGTYWVRASGTTWQPVAVTENGQLASVGQQYAALKLEDVPTLPYPIHSAMEIREDSLTYVPHVWVDNPFTTTVTVTVTQPLPDAIEVLDANEGTLAGQNLVWSRPVPPETSIEITHVIACAGPSGVVLDYPAVVLEMSDAASFATFDSNSVSFKRQAPLAGEAQPPYEMRVNAATTVPITVTNRSALAVSGTITLTLKTLESAPVHTVSRAVDVPAQGAVSDALPLVAPAEEGTYILRASVSSNGGTSEIFANYVEVIQPRRYLPLVLR